MKADPLDTCNRADKLRRRRWLPCAFCPPGRGENSIRRPRHGAQRARRGWTRESIRGWAGGDR